MLEIITLILWVLVGPLILKLEKDLKMMKVYYSLAWFCLILELVSNII